MDNAVVIGVFQGAVDFGGGSMNSAGGRDIFVAKLAGADGSHIWSRHFGSPYEDGGSAVALDASGNPIVTGNFLGMVDFGGGSVGHTTGRDAFVLKLRY